ncbi:MAG TPA: TonB-dependent receptor, partial [Polyangia bacterium]
LAGANLGGERIDQREDRIDAAHLPFARTRDLAGWLGGMGARIGARWLVGRSFALEGGVRAEGFWFHLQDAGAGSARAFRPALLPRLSGTVFATEGLIVTAAYGRGVRPPEARAMTGGRGDADASSGYRGSAQPTISDGADLGLRWRPTDMLELGAGGFATVIAREQVFDHVAGVNLTRSATRRLGLEADLSVRPHPWLSFRLDGTAVDARFTGSGQSVPGAPTLFGSFEAHLFHPGGWTGGVRAIALGPRPLAHGARGGSAFIADALLGHRGRWWDVSLSVENLAGTRWREGEFNYASWFDRSQPRSEVPRLHYAAGPPRVIQLSVGVRR